jgi:hypothetical protein
MNSIEDELKTALRRKPAPPGFTERVFERIENDAFDKHSPRRLFPKRYLIAAAAALFMAAAGLGLLGYRHHIQTRNEAALRRTLTALSIVAENLNRAEKIALDPERWERLNEQLTKLQIEGKK